MNIASSSFQFGVEVRGHEGITVEARSASPFAIFLRRVSIGGHKRVAVTGASGSACGQHCRAEAALAYSARMLRRLAGGTAILAAAVVGLAACSNPTPPDTSSSPQSSASASPDTEALLDEAARLFDDYWTAVLEMTKARSTDATALREIATEEVAQAASESVDLSIEGGVVPSAVPQVTSFEANDAPSLDGFAIRVCTDPASTAPVTLEGEPVPLPSGQQEVPWLLEVGPRPDDAGLWIVGLEPADRAEQPCSS